MSLICLTKSIQSSVLEEACTFFNSSRESWECTTGRRTVKLLTNGSSITKIYEVRNLAMENHGNLLGRQKVWKHCLSLRCRYGSWDMPSSELWLKTSRGFKLGRHVIKETCITPVTRFQCFHQNIEEALLASSFEGAEVTQKDSDGLPMVDGCNKVNEQLKVEISAPSLRTETEVSLAHYIPVYVMLPLDVISKDNKFHNVDLLDVNLRALKAAHVDGLMVDVWWGLVERAQSKQYDWSAYRSLFQLIQNHGFKLQVVMSFHQCGGNVGDSCHIPLPHWVLEAGESNPDIFFTNRDGKRNREYLSFGIDNKPVLNGQTAVEVYMDFMKSFREHMSDFLESGLITEIEVGLGPAGELRYPSYPESHGWRFPGIGEFQCYDKYLLAELKEAADTIGQNEWGYSGPHDAGHYNDWPQATGFFCNHGSFRTDYGRFFLEWYSNVLLTHGDRILESAADSFVGCTVKLAAKIAGVHWWYNSKNHAAELAAGYYNLRERDGYKPIAKMLARHSAILNFTCIEMRDDEQYWEARCGPEGLVRQVLSVGWNEGIEVSCENALPRYDKGPFDQILRNARPLGISKDGPPRRRISTFTFLRLGQELMQESNWREFNKFVRSMHAYLDYHPDPEKYFYPRAPLQKSKPKKALQEVPVVPVASVPLDHHHVPLAPKKELEPFFSQDAPGGGLGRQVGEIGGPLTGHGFTSSVPLWEKEGLSPSSMVVDNDGEELQEEICDSGQGFTAFAQLWENAGESPSSMVVGDDSEELPEDLCDRNDFPGFLL